MGFSARDGIDFVLEMLTGTIVMLKESGNHPAEIRWRITSPGGITSAGLRKMEDTAIRGSVINAFLAAYQRAQQMARKHDQKKFTTEAQRHREGRGVCWARNINRICMIA